MTKKKSQVKEPANRMLSLPDIIANDIKKVADLLKVEPWNLRWWDYHSNGGKYGSFVPNVGGWNSIRDTYFQKPISPQYSVLLSDISKNQRELNKKIGSKDIFLSELSHILAHFPKISIAPYRSSKKNVAIDRALNVVISDLHIGSDLDREETGHQYGVFEEARVVAHLTKTVCEYKPKYRDNTELHVHLYGDMIQNQLHGASSADLLHLQTCRAIWLLTQMIGRFSQNFKKVTVHCAVGNHGRDTAIHHSRAIHQKYNAVETTIYYGIHTGVRHLKNVIWDQPKSPWVDVTVLGHRIYGTHGDTNFSIGNPGSSINVKKIENTMNQINASLQDTKEYKVFIVGHAHTGMVSKLSNGAFLIVNGPGTPPDPFAESLNIMEGPQDQVMFETTKEYAVGDLRFIDMAGTATDKSLDEIIEPWKGLSR